jgi:hypothetical protein
MNKMNMRPIDYQNPANRLSGRARTNKSNLMAIGAAVAIVLGFLAYATLGI